MLLGVDVGGTFTDAVVFDGDQLFTAKAPTTPEDQSEGVLAAIEAALERAGAAPGDVETFAHGMTVGTNALLERRGARTALIATRGFADLLEIRRQNRPRLYHLCAPRPSPSWRRRTASRPASASALPAWSSRSTGRARPDRERGRRARGRSRSRSACSSPTWSPRTSARSPSACASASPASTSPPRCEVLPQFREYERCSTTVIDAYLSPLLRATSVGSARPRPRAGCPSPR